MKLERREPVKRVMEIKRLNSRGIVKMAGNIVMGIGLGILGFQDWRKKYVSLWLTVSMCILAFILKVIEQKNVLENIAAGIFLGLLLLVIGKITGNGIGEGDALILLGLGIYMGIFQAAAVLFYGLVGCALTGMIFMILRKKKWKEEIAFIPFLFAGYIIQVFWGG